MKAKSKQDFFDELKKELNRIGIEDTDEIFADFEEHFADSAMQGVSEEETAERLGDVKEIARSYLNLESSRINSIIARDIEHKKGVSLTKPGHSVPADLSLLKGKEAADSDCVRSYTPEHLSEEIYPNVGAKNANNINTGFTNNSANINNNYNSSYTNNSANSTTNNSANANTNSQNGAGEQTVAGAFSTAGKAAWDAAKVTGHAIADACRNNGVKDAVVEAGKSAADAVKTAGHAVKKAKNEHDRMRSDAAPRPSDSFREHSNNDRRGTIPPQHTKAQTKGGGFKYTDLSSKKSDVNAGKLLLAVFLDICIWIWVIPAIAGIIIGIFSGAIALVGCAFTALFGLGDFWVYYFPSRLFLSIAFMATVIILVFLAMLLIKAIIHLIKYIIELHIKAIYNL